MPRILITAFEPFGGDSENASAEVLALVLDTVAARATALPAGVELVAEVLPVVFDGAAFERAVHRHAPDALLCLGEAGLRRIVTVERVAVNTMAARIPDNDCRRPHGAVIDPDGPESRTAGIDADAICAAFRSTGVEEVPSDDAGRFVCNATAYRAFGREVPSVFVHLPALRRSGAAGVGAETDAPGARRPERAASTHAELAAGVVAALGAISTELAPGVERG
ncbi:MAG: pyroglutamyl-peptidase I [Microbacteriaceae bacterium]|nr:pyroglutamyl-peptidase I [Microbacteriaceae bacterium]